MNATQLYNNADTFRFRPEASETPDPGFADPVHDAQSCYRTVLQALSRPLVPWSLETDRLPMSPDPLSPALAALALTLCDQDTPVWLSRSLRTPAVEAWLRFHTSCPLTGDPKAAAFALAVDGGEMLPLAAYAQGDPRWPDQSTTVLVAGLRFAGRPEALTFTGRGPGIRDRAVLSCAGLPEDFAVQWEANNAGYPLGVDMVLLDGPTLAGLPRSTRLSTS